jgi:sugar lactone lactonase YvrE
MITTYAGNGKNGYAGDGGPAVNAQFAGTSYGPPLAVDPAGNLYLADSYNNRIRKVSRDGTINTIAGNGTGCCFSGDGGPATRAQFYVPAGVAADANGNAYVADTFNNRIRKIDRAGMIATVAGTAAAAPL